MSEIALDPLTQFVVHIFGISIAYGWIRLKNVLNLFHKYFFIIDSRNNLRNMLLHLYILRYHLCGRRIVERPEKIDNLVAKKLWNE